MVVTHTKQTNHRFSFAALFLFAKAAWLASCSFFRPRRCQFVPFLQRVPVAMVDQWNNQCKGHLEQHKCLQHLAFTGLDGTIYGNSNAAEFPACYGAWLSSTSFVKWFSGVS
ncbi:hypothetical protein PHET_09020 [Paragonimus heterotremus]|uniref:Uncharacterized protein n=1 Tax=Paragonimus heterotremus TaxID=100268 RepID=A0A8J4SVX5_9TREM|nr:hypothetical protein PHET_09020 [Paragonimus heterotremus]